MRAIRGRHRAPGCRSLLHIHRRRSRENTGGIHAALRRTRIRRETRFDRRRKRPIRESRDMTCAFYSDFHGLTSRIVGRRAHDVKWAPVNGWFPCSRGNCARGASRRSVSGQSARKSGLPASHAVATAETSATCLIIFVSRFADCSPRSLDNGSRRIGRSHFHFDITPPSKNIRKRERKPCPRLEFLSTIGNACSATSRRFQSTEPIDRTIGSAGQRTWPADVTCLLNDKSRETESGGERERQ